MGTLFDFTDSKVILKEKVTSMTKMELVELRNRMNFLRNLTQLCYHFKDDLNIIAKDENSDSDLLHLFHNPCLIGNAIEKVNGLIISLVKKRMG